ncbi:MAG TPA: serine/threonine-protein kinase [Thermoanaerobaculia bacterium]
MPTQNADRWGRWSAHLDLLLDLPAAQRTARLEALETEDATLASDLRGLLEEHEALDREGFLENAVFPGGPPPAGRTFGAYTLVSLIGQGGMGNVWLARRSDGRFEGTAAVKLLNASLIGRSGEERFRREGTILARLTHPHIAHLVDAGVSPDGQPYLVLEHVSGDRIDHDSDRRGLGVQERLRLFLDVLDAVGHAHANLIVHRDLKPSNVFVTSDGRVKLLDFGIAKLLEGEAVAGEATALTRDGGRALTPEYAAPEQVTGGPITTATDVYALGVLLYLLLSGRHPAQEKLSSPADLLKAIVDTEPPRLSEVAATAGPAAGSRERARKQLQGDLETIVAKALKKNPRERYASVTAFAEDIRRYLDQEPISARPDTLAYRAAKFVRRNRAAVALAGLALLALSAGLLGTLTQARRATRHAADAEEQARAARTQRDFAIRQLSRAEAINDLNAFLLSDAAPVGRPFTARELLERAEGIVDRQQAETAENRVEMLVAIGRLYGSRDEEAKAREVLGRAYALSRNVSDPTVRARAAAALAGAIAAGGDFERGEGLIQEGLRELGESPQFALARVYCLLRGSYVARESGNDAEAIARVERARELLAGSGQGSPLLDLSVSMDLAESYRMAGRHREAAAAFQDAYRRLSELGREDTERAGTILNNWAMAVLLLGQPREAEELFRKAIAIGKSDDAEAGVSPMLLNNIARPLNELHRFAEAADYNRRAYERARQAGDEMVVSQALSMLFAIGIESGDLKSAERALAGFAPRWRRMPPGHIAHAALPLNEAMLASRRGEHRTAVEKAEKAIALARESSMSSDYLPSFLLRRSAIYLAAGKFEEARRDAEESLRRERAIGIEGVPSSIVGRCHLAIARALQGEGRADAARAAFASAFENLEPTLGADHPKTREAQHGAAAIPRAARDPSPSRSAAPAVSRRAPGRRRPRSRPCSRCR